MTTSGHIGKLSIYTRLAFPEEHLGRFFIEGLMRKKQAEALRGTTLRNPRAFCELYDVRGLYYFTMLAFGALRSCEPLHLFLEDVEFDFEGGSGAIVWLYHPAKGGMSTKHGNWEDRQTYLEDRFGLQPRNLVKGHQHAGWKNLLLDESVPGVGKRSRVHWLVPEMARLAWHLHQTYTRLIRPKINDHPYLFSSSWGQAYGAPWTLDAVNRTFRQAVNKIGLTPSAASGLNMHGFRHRAAHWMRLGDVPPDIRQLVLHHRSVESQEVYGRANAADVANRLRAATYYQSCRDDQVKYSDVFLPAEQRSRFVEIGRQIATTFLEGAL